MSLGMWLTMPTAAQHSHSAHGGEHPAQLHGSLLVDALLLHGGGWEASLGHGKATGGKKMPPLLPKEPRVCSQARAVPALLAGHMSVLGCLQLVLGSAAALQTGGQRAPA